jgi:hypothetical protein
VDITARQLRYSNKQKFNKKFDLSTSIGYTYNVATNSATLGGDRNDTCDSVTKSSEDRSQGIS